MASPHALPHARRADCPIKKKPQGKRNLPANKAVTRWLIVETLKRATPQKVVQLALCSEILLPLSGPEIPAGTHVRSSVSVRATSSVLRVW